jgi:hypothetical protein
MSPKRVLDGDGLWRSDKIARVEPPKARPEYANILPLAFANGSFECSPRKVWASVYSYNRPDVSVEDVETFLSAFESTGLLFRWNEPDGKSWAYFTGIDKPGRLPGQSRRKKNEKIGAEPPKEALRKFLESKNFPGFGFGSGLGIKPSCADESSLHESVLPISTPDRSPERQTVERLWNYYLEKLNKNPRLLKLTPKRVQKGTARLKECLAKAEGDLAKAEALMMVAIDNLAASTYHCENGYDSWDENLFKTGEKLDWWLERPELNKQRAG